MVTHVTNRPTATLSIKATSPGRRQTGARLAYPAAVPKVVIDVMLKPEIHDPQGDAIAGACRRLGFDQVAGVRQGKRFELELTEPASRERLAELAAELLANPVIEEFSIEPL
jgi:phosphoribosylformylglycinamidine synthase subunit PurS